MVDNVTANPGKGGATFASDDDGIAQHPYVKLEFGDNDTQTKVSPTNPLPVTASSSAPVPVTDNGGSLTVDNGGVFSVQNTAALQPGTNVIGQVAASPETATLFNGATPLTPKFAAIGVAASGENTLVAAVTGKQIRVLALAIVATSAISVFFDNATNGAIFGGSTNKIALAANGSLVLPFSPLGWFQTGTVNEALRINLSAATAVAGGLVYVEI